VATEEPNARHFYRKNRQNKPFTAKKSEKIEIWACIIGNTNYKMYQLSVEPFGIHNQFSKAGEER
jgi:hypothetical protein